MKSVLWGRGSVSRTSRKVAGHDQMGPHSDHAPQPAMMSMMMPGMGPPLSSTMGMSLRGGAQRPCHPARSMYAANWHAVHSFAECRHILVA